MRACNPAPARHRADGGGGRARCGARLVPLGLGAWGARGRGRPVCQRAAKQLLRVLAVHAAAAAHAAAVRHLRRGVADGGLRPPAAPHSHVLVLAGSGAFSRA